jgi:hypothetical protein
VPPSQSRTFAPIVPIADSTANHTPPTSCANHEHCCANSHKNGAPARRPRQPTSSPTSPMPSCL